MATTHTARRRQRTSTRRTTTHGRAHRTRQNRSTAPSDVTRSPAPVVEAPIPAAVEVPTRAVAKPMRSPDSDDHLAAYFRQLAEHELLTPEDERELSQGIEDTEILTWERVFARPDVVFQLLALVEPNLEQPQKFPKLQKIAEEM